MHKIEKFIATLTPQQVFLLDAAGAFLTAFLLGVVLPQFQSYFGIPIYLLYLLALIAFCFFIYSLSCFWLYPRNWSPYLQGIATANLAYCLLTLSLVFYHYHTFTVLGILYFVIEALIVAALAFFELRFSRRK